MYRLFIILLLSCSKDIEQKKLGVDGFDVRYTNKWIPIDSTVTHWCVEDESELGRYDGRNDTICGQFRIFKWRITECKHFNNE